ncbi:MAG: hypothetical protein SPH82_02700 [Eubacteriales bacterium]|nr:hypothetical protein [Eubacteriales bacterium]
MKKKKLDFRTAWRLGDTKLLAGTVVAAFICFGLARFCSEMQIGALPVVLAVVSLLLMLSATFIIVICMHGDYSSPMTAIVRNIPSIIVIMLLLIPITLGYATKTTYPIQQNDFWYWGIRLDYFANLFILAGGMMLCTIYAFLRGCKTQRRWLIVILKTCTLGGSLCAATILTYKYSCVKAWLLIPELFVLLVTAVILLLCWRRALSES